MKPISRLPNPTRLRLAAAVPLAFLLGGTGLAAALCGDGGADGRGAPIPLRGLDRAIVLTFDASWSDDGAAAVLDALRDHGVRATFFIAGRFAVGHPEIARRIAAEGHEAANHTFHHDHLTRDLGSGRRETLPGVTAASLREEMELTAQAYLQATGRTLCPLWRAPYGETNEEILEWGREAGYTHFGWSEGLDALDWVSDEASALYLTPAAAASRLLAKLAGRSGSEGPAVLLMHLGSTRPAGRRFADALPRLIEGATLLGYRFETAGEAMKEGAVP